jgi:hypothetical protein
VSTATRPALTALLADIKDAIELVGADLDKTRANLQHAMAHGLDDLSVKFHALEKAQEHRAGLLLDQHADVEILLLKAD